MKNEVKTEEVAACVGVLIGIAVRVLCFGALIVLGLWIAKAAIALGIAPALW